MTRIDAWKCDICGKIFLYEKNDPYYLNPSEIHLTMDAPSMAFFEMKHHFSQVCIKCRKIIKSKIWEAIYECLPEET